MGDPAFIAKATAAGCSPEKQGVDLNRNYAEDFWSQGDFCDEFYGGTAPFSEKETAAVRDFLQSVKNELRFVVNFHCLKPAFEWAFQVESRAPQVAPILA